METLVQRGQSETRTRKVTSVDLDAVRLKIDAGKSLTQACDELGLRYGGVHKALSRIKKAQQCRSQ